MQCWQSHTNPQSRWATRDSVTDNLLCKFPRPRLAWLRSQSRLRPCELPFSAVLTSYLFLIREKVIVLFFHLVGDEGLSHDKFSPKIFATPPQSVTFVIRLPALRTAVGQFSPPKLAAHTFGNNLGRNNSWWSSLGFRLSYPIWWSVGDSNPGPPACKAGALAN